MDENKEPRLDNTATVRASNSTTPIAAKANEAMTKNSTQTTVKPFYKRGWFKITVTIAALVAFGSVIEIPNTVMDLFHNARSTFKKESTARAFSIESFPITRADGVQNFILWQNGQVLSPIGVIMFARITNLKEIPVTIREWKFEGRATDGNWTNLPLIEPRYGKLVIHHGDYYGVGDPEKVGFKNFFPTAIEGIELDKGRSIRCWVLLESPITDFDGEVRLRIRDTTGSEYVEPAAVVNQTDESWSVVQERVTGWGYFPTTNDLSQLPVKSFTEEKQRLKLP